MFSSKGPRTLAHSRVLLRSKRQCSILQTAALSGSSIKSLQDAFREPSSPFYIAPGQTRLEFSGGSPPSLSQVPHPTRPLHQPSYPTAISSPAENARAKLISMGYDAGSLWEQIIVWGHQDASRVTHESATADIQYDSSNRSACYAVVKGYVMWCMAIGKALGGEERVKAILAGQGVSFILKSVNVNFKRPVTFPDTLLIGHKPMISSSRTHFTLNSVLYSYSQQAVVANSDSVLVWYDYDNLKKCDPGDGAWRILKAASQDGQVKGLVQQVAKRHVGDGTDIGYNWKNRRLNAHTIVRVLDSSRYLAMEPLTVQKYNEGISAGGSKCVGIYKATKTSKENLME
ncbi:hypothetical protein DFH29DRAFT_883340 [Suillus ampliporus]|nr:hypothetical protein DFH29DRAFT_883340 [Suillus ampliporus]